MSPSPDKKNNRDLLRYAGLASEIAAGLVISVFIGLKADQWFHWSFPVFRWALPLLVIAGLIVMLIKETGGKRNDKHKNG